MARKEDLGRMARMGDLGRMGKMGEMPKMEKMGETVYQVFEISFFLEDVDLNWKKKKMISNWLSVCLIYFYYNFFLL